MFFFQYFGALLRHSSKSDKIKRLKFILFYANKYNLVFLVRKEKYDRFFFNQVTIKRCESQSLASFQNFFIVILLQFSQFPPPHLPLPRSPPAPRVNPHTFVHVHVSFVHVLCLVPSPSLHHYAPPYPLWPLSICSMFPFLWFYFAHQFIVFIRFLSQARSYGICHSPTGLFHLA